MPSAAAPPPRPAAFPTRRSSDLGRGHTVGGGPPHYRGSADVGLSHVRSAAGDGAPLRLAGRPLPARRGLADRAQQSRRRRRIGAPRSEEHTSELQSPCNLVCRLLPLPPRVPPLSLHDALPILGAGTPSAEGPLTTAAPQTWGFRTFGPLRVTGHRCGWQEGRCPPGAAWQIELSNPVDAAASVPRDRKSTRLNSSHLVISYAVCCRSPPASRRFPYTTLFRSWARAHRRRRAPSLPRLRRRGAFARSVRCG